MPKQSPVLRSYNQLRSKKKKLCMGKTTKSEVKKAASAYVTKAVKAGQTKAEAQRKANRVLNSGCSMSSAVRGRKKKTRKAPARSKKQ
jgi:hypothetical protein